MESSSQLSQASAASDGTNMRQFLNDCRELGQVLHGASAVTSTARYILAGCFELDFLDDEYDCVVKRW